MEDLANQSGRERCVLLMDRGAMDGKAYMSDAQWELMLEELSFHGIRWRLLDRPGVEARDTRPLYETLAARL